MALVAGATHLYHVRYAKSRAPTPPLIFKCPGCSHSIEKINRQSSGQFVCPNCREKLKLTFSNWPPFLGGVIGAVSALYLLHLDSLLWLVLIAPFFLLFAFLSAASMAALFPERARVEFTRNRFDRTLFRL
jgi:hypothetical protein